MSFEVESKFPTGRSTEIRRRLEVLGAQPQPPVVLIDCYYAHPARDFAATREAFRLRRAGARNYLTYKGPQLKTETKTRKEIELAVAEGEEGAALCAALLEALGFRPIATVRKQRSRMSLSWRGRTVEAALDEVEKLGSFVELEILCQEPELAATQEVLAELTRTLGLGRAEPRTYLELLLERRDKASE